MGTSSGDGKDSKAPQSVGELQGLMLLARQQTRTLVLEDRSITLPPLTPPSLEGLKVKTPAIAPVTPEELYARFQELREQAAPRRELARGAPVSEGHEVVMDVVGHAQGRPIPFSARTGWTTLVRPDPLLPGFFEALVGAQVGATKELPVTLPPDYPVESLRGVAARFTVEVKAARELSLPEEDSPEGLKMLGRGATIEEAMVSIQKELMQEHVAEARRQLQEHVWNLLLERCVVELPVALVDEEIRRQWMATEQPALQRWKASAQELQQSLRSWLEDPRTQAETERRLGVALLLGAIAARDKIQPSAKDVEEFVTSMAATSNMSRAELKKMLSTNSAAAQQVHNLLLHVAATNHVMSKVILED